MAEVVGTNPRRRLRLSCSKLYEVELARLVDHELAALAPYCRPIEQGPGVTIRRGISIEKLALPRIFVSAQMLVGPTSTRFDHDKGSFRYPLLFSAGSRVARYVAVLEDVRGCPDVRFHRVDLDGDPDPRGYRNRSYVPVEGEPSREDLDYVGDYLIGYLEGRGHDLGRLSPPFYRTVPSECYVYGKHGGELFERELASHRELEEAVAVLEREVGPAQRDTQRTFVTALLDRIDREGRQTPDSIDRLRSTNHFKRTD